MKRRSVLDMLTPEVLADLQALGIEGERRMLGAWLSLLGLTRQDLAAKLDLHPTQVSRFGTAQAEGRPGEREKIRRAIGLDAPADEDARQDLETAADLIDHPGAAALAAKTLRTYARDMTRRPGTAALAVARAIIAGSRRRRDTLRP